MAVVHELIVGGTEDFIPGKFPVATFIDQGLGMFDAEANGKGFGFDVNALVMDHLESIPRTVAHGQHHMGTGDKFAIFEGDAFNLMIF